MVEVIFFLVPIRRRIVVNVLKEEGIFTLGLKPPEREWIVAQ